MSSGIRENILTANPALTGGSEDHDLIRVLGASRPEFSLYHRNLANIQGFIEHGKGLTREVQVIHFHSSRRDPAN
jgi:hypothetical protein